MFELSRRNNNQVHTYNPFKEMEQLERDFFGDPFGSFFNSSDLAEFKTDVLDEGDHYELEADLPGFNKEDIKLELQGDNLVISAERAEEKNKDGKVVRMERSYGSYQRSFNVSQIDTDHIKAAYDNGVLKLNLPKLQSQIPQSRVLEIE